MDIFLDFLKAYFFCIFLFLLPPLLRILEHGDGQFKLARPNGVRQGATLSAIAYCFYCEELFFLLESRRSGCWVNGFFLGLLGYSDHNICLAPSLSALQDRHVNHMLQHTTQDSLQIQIQQSVKPKPWLFWKKCSLSQTYSSVVTLFLGLTSVSTSKVWQ